MKNKLTVMLILCFAVSVLLLGCNPANSGKAGSAVLLSPRIDINEIEWENVINKPWDGPAKLGHFDEFIKTNGAHPRLLLTRAKIDALKTRINSGIYSDIWKTVKSKADGYLISSPKNKPDSQNPTRDDGDAPPWLALAYLMSTERVYLNKSIDWMTVVCNYPKWGSNRSLAAGHCLMGISLGYDWLYNDMTDNQRQTIKSRLVYFAGQLAINPQHKESFLTNHCQVEYAALAAAGFALYGDVPQAQDWLRQAYNIFSAAFSVCGDDGSSTEGHQYYGLKMEFQLIFDKMAKELLGMDFYKDSPWLRNAGGFILYSTLPGYTASDFTMRYGDTSKYNYGSHGPIYQLFNLAGEYRDPYLQQLAIDMLKKDISTTDRMGWADLLWYDETVDARPIDELATFRHFEDTGWITTRSDWGSDAVMVGFKCGPPHGHAVQALYDRMKTFHQIVNGHGHPDVGQFDIFAYGRHLAVDDAYPKPKWTKNHNTIIVNGTGQLGEGSDWFDRDAVFVVKPASHIIKAENTARFDYIIGDAGNIYPKSAGLGKFYRHLVYVKPDLILVVDELQSCKSSGFEWRLHAGGPLRQMDSDYCIVENDGVNMDICFVHPTDITIGIKEKVLSGSFTGAGEQIMAVVMHPRKAADSPALIKSYSLVGGLLDVVIQYGNETKNIRLDVAGRKVTIF